MNEGRRRKKNEKDEGLRRQRTALRPVRSGRSWLNATRQKQMAPGTFHKH